MLHEPMYARPIQKLIMAFSKLPSVGTRTAERFVFALLKSGKKDVGELTLALQNLMEQVKSCAVCFDFSDTSPCTICANEKREQSVICVVAEPQDLQTLERVGTYRGLYHVLRGRIRTDEENILEKLKLGELFTRVQQPQVLEVILALSPDMSGETTMLYLEEKLKTLKPTIILSRLARGLPMGSDLQYADQITLESALRNRTRS